VVLEHPAYVLGVATCDFFPTMRNHDTGSRFETGRELESYHGYSEQLAGELFVDML
jgi:hypothetical protein